MYLVATRPDIMYGVSQISRFKESPKDYHWQEGKIILRYVNGTRNYGIHYSYLDEFKLIGYTDSDCVDSIVDRKSTPSYVFHFGIGVVSWASKKQPIVSVSLVKVEYVVTTKVVCQAIWLRRVLENLRYK